MVGIFRGNLYCFDRQLFDAGGGGMCESSVDELTAAQTCVESY